MERTRTVRPAAARSPPGIRLRRAGLRVAVIVALAGLPNPTLPGSDSSLSAVVPAPQTRGEVSFTVPPDTPGPVRFSLQGWVCASGELDEALNRLRAALEKTPYGQRPALLGPDIASALRRTGGFELQSGPSVTVPAPGRKIVEPCYDAETWSLIRGRIERLIADTPYRVPEPAGPEAATGPGRIGRIIEADPSGRRLLVPARPQRRPESIARLPEGETVTGGAPIGRAPGLAVPPGEGGADSPPPAAAGNPVIGSDGRPVGHVRKDPTGTAWFTPRTPEGAMPAAPQRVEILPGGHVVWGMIRIGRMVAAAPEEISPREQLAEDPVGKPVYGRNGQLLGRLVTAPDGKHYLAPETPPGAMPAEPQLVERYPDGSIFWAGRRIGGLKRPRPTGTETAKETPPAETPPAETSKTAATAPDAPKPPAAAPVDAEQAALEHIRSLERARSLTLARIRDLRARKDRLHASILKLLQDRSLEREQEITREVRRLEARWEKLRKQQAGHFERLERLNETLFKARAGLPEARRLAREQRRRSEIADWVKELYRDRPSGPVSPVTELIVSLEKALGSEELDRIIAAFKRESGKGTPLRFLDFLRRRIASSPGATGALRDGIAQDYLRISAAILRDPERARLWGVRKAEIPELRERVIRETAARIRKLEGALKSAPKLKTAEDLLELHLLRAGLLEGVRRREQNRRIMSVVAELERLALQEAPRETAAAIRHWSRYSERLRQLILQAARSETPFDRRVSALVAQSLARGLVRQADLAATPDSQSAALRLAAARAHLVAGKMTEALAQARLAEQAGDGDTRLSARMLQIVALKDLKRRVARLSAAQRRALVLHGQGHTPGGRIRNGIDAAFLRIIDDSETPENQKLAALLALWQQGAPKARQQAAAMLERMLADARDSGEALPPLLAAWEVLGKWPQGETPPRQRADLLERLSGNDSGTLIALSQLLFSADLGREARKDLALAVESLFWKALRSTEDEAARNRLIRAAIAHYRNYLSHYYLNNPDTLSATGFGSTSSEADRVLGNLHYWVDRLPKAERPRHKGVIAFARAVRQVLAARDEARGALDAGAIGRSNDIDKLIGFAFRQFRMGNIRNAIRAFERALDISGREDTPERSIALMESMLRLVDRQAQGDLPIVLGEAILAGRPGKEQLRALALMTPEERAQLSRLRGPERDALEKFTDRLRKRYAEALEKAALDEAEIIIRKTVDRIAALPEDATDDEGARLESLRQEQQRALERYRRLMRMKARTGSADKATLEGQLNRLNRQIRDGMQRLENLRRKSARPEEAGTPSRKLLLVELARLNLLRAERDAIQDLVMELFPVTRSALTRREQLVRSIFDAINGRPDRPNERLRRNGVLQQLFTADDPTGWTQMVLNDRLRYLRARRRAVMMEDPERDPSESVRAYLRELEREKTYWEGEGKRLSYGPFDLGRDQRAFAETLEREARFGEAPTLIDRLVAESRRADPQKFFALLAQLQDGELDKGLEAYNKYLETPWYRLGLSQGYRLASGYLRLGSYWDYNEVLDRFRDRINETGALNAALLSAARLPVEKLKARNRQAYRLLERLGFIDKGRYAIPDDFVFQPGTGLDEASQRTLLDDLVNVQAVGEAALTVILPGRLSFAATEYVASRWLTLNALGRLGVEAAFFTGYSRAGSLVLDPALALEKDYWSARSWFGEYVHNLAVMGGLQVTGAAAGRLGQTVRDGTPLRYGAADIMNMPLSRLRDVSAREWQWFLFGGAGKLGAEALTLQMIDRVFSGTEVDGEGLLRNLVFLAELKATGLPFNKLLNRLTGPAAPRENLTERKARQDGRESALRLLMEKYNGDWQQLVDAFKAGKVPERTMRELTRMRKEVVDALADEVVLNIYGLDRMAREKLWDAVGSVNLTSDYDLSFKGEKAELAVLLFNERFRSRWGKALGIGGVESAGRLDTNVYTYPRYREYVGNEKDVLSQEAAAQLGVRRYATDAQWKAHRKRVLDALEGTQKAQMRNILDRVERNYARARRELDKLSAGGDENALTFAANTLYGRALKRIILLREQFGKARSDAERSRIAQEIRDTQARALYFASEAYLTEAAINHVVFNTQLVGRKITAETLLSGKVEPLNLPMTANQARQSLFEQHGYLLHQYAHYPGYAENPKTAVKLAGKLSKYFLRLLDAAHIAGVDLSSREKLVRLTVEVERNRGNTEKLAEILPGRKAAEYARDVREAMEWLAGEVYRKAPVSPVELRPQPAPPAGPRQVSTQPVAPPRAAEPPRTARGAGTGPAAGGAGDDRQDARTTGRQRPHRVVDENGDQNGWVSLDPNAQAWFQPLGPPGTLPPPPQKVEILKGGGVVTPYRRIGRTAPSGTGGTGGQSKRGMAGNTGGAGNAPSARSAGPPNAPPAGGQVNAPLHPPAGAAKSASGQPGRIVVQGSGRGIPAPPAGTGSPPEQAPAPQSRPVLDDDGNVIGRLETDPNGQSWFRPAQPEGVMATPPQKVEVTADGSVVMGMRRIGRLGAREQGRQTGRPAGAEPAAQDRAVRDAQGDVIGHVRLDPTGTAWFSPLVPPGILTTPPQPVEVLEGGQVILGGRIIGQLEPKRKGASLSMTALSGGQRIELLVAILPGEGQTVTTAPAQEAERGTGFEGLWLGWKGSVIRNLREGNRIRGVIEKLPAEMVATGWKLGDSFYEAEIEGEKLVGQAFIPLSGIPGCQGVFARMAFEAWLVDRGEGLASRIEVMGPGPGCQYTNTGRWTPMITATRITEPQDTPEMQTGPAAEEGERAPETPVPPEAIGEPETGQPGLPEGFPATLEIMTPEGAAVFPLRPPPPVFPPSPQGGGFAADLQMIPPAPQDVRPEDLALIERGRALLAYGAANCPQEWMGLYASLTNFYYELLTALPENPELMPNMQGGTAMVLGAAETAANDGFPGDQQLDAEWMLDRARQELQGLIDTLQRCQASAAE